jgi:hypothetical protein
VLVDVVNGVRLITAHEFFSHLRDSGDVSRPIGDVLLGTHANSSGQMFIALFRDPDTDGPVSSIDYEKLEDSLNKANRSAKIDDTVFVT